MPKTVLLPGSICVRPASRIRHVVKPFCFAWRRKSSLKQTKRTFFSPRPTNEQFFRRFATANDFRLAAGEPGVHRFWPFFTGLLETTQGRVRTLAKRVKNPPTNSIVLLVPRLFLKEENFVRESTKRRFTYLCPFSDRCERRAPSGKNASGGKSRRSFSFTLYSPSESEQPGSNCSETTKISPF